MSKLSRHLFLDLEDTIITPVMDGWFNTHLINVQKIKQVIEDFDPIEIHIFSFAIWNQAELRGFNMGIRPMIEQALGRTLSAVPTVDDDIIPVCCKVKGISPDRVDFSDCSDFWGKHEAFRLNMRNLFRTNWKNWEIETEVVFLDDAVWDESFSWPDMRIRGQIINIDNHQHLTISHKEPPWAQ